MQKLKETFWVLCKDMKNILRTADQESTNSKKKRKTSEKLATFVKYENAR